MIHAHRSWRRAALAACLGASLLSGGCGDKPAEPLPVASAPTPSASTPRPDARGKGLVEGDLELFGLKLPVRTEVIRKTSRMAVVNFVGEADQARDYFAAQLEGPAAKPGPRGGFDFENVRAKGAPATAPALWIGIRRRRSRTEVTIQQKLVAPAASAPAASP